MRENVLYETMGWTTHQLFEEQALFALSKNTLRGTVKALLASGGAIGIFALTAALPLLPATPLDRAEASTRGVTQTVPSHVPDEIVVKYKAKVDQHARAKAQAASGVHRPQITAPRTRVLKVAPGHSLTGALEQLREREEIEYAVPNLIARASAAVSNPSGELIPNDRGATKESGGWQKTQWNFLAQSGINTPGAWANLVRAGKPGGKGVKVAVLDTGVAYRSRKGLPRSPDLSATTFVRGYDFVDSDPHPHDFNGHGTHVASTIAEATGNGYGLTGIAYGAQIMPIRVLDEFGAGDAVTIARGIRFAAKNGAQIINLSLEFNSATVASEIPEIIEALIFAKRKGAILVGAAGNEAQASIAYPAKNSGVISVGATTEYLCVADYSNRGRGLDIVAPGGGLNAYMPNEPEHCNPAQRPGRDIFQITFSSSVRKFGIPSGYEGTSMAAPHVSGVIALVIASGVLGPKPTQAQILRHLNRTARDLGRPGYDQIYGWGLIDAAAATAPAASRSPAG